MIRWPLPYEHEPNDYEVVGRYIAQTIHMERFIDLILLKDGARPSDLKHAKLAAKIKSLQSFLQRPDNGLDDEWQDVPARLAAVAGYRNLFAHRMMDRTPMPAHLAGGLAFERLSVEDQRQQESAAFEATEMVRVLYVCLHEGPLNPQFRYSRHGRIERGAAGA